MSFDFIDRKFGARRPAPAIGAGDLDIGSPCPVSGCAGRLVLPQADDCSCHVAPPCHACVSARLTCEACGWEAPERA